MSHLSPHGSSRLKTMSFGNETKLMSQVDGPEYDPVPRIFPLDLRIERCDVGWKSCSADDVEIYHLVRHKGMEEGTD